MKNITTEIRKFLSSTGLKQCVLAREAGVSTATINRIFKEKQNDMIESRANKIRSAMDRLRRLSSPSTPSEPEEARHAD